MIVSTYVFVSIILKSISESLPRSVSTSCLVAGGLIYYDFGMMSEIGTARRGSLLDVFYGVYRRDAEAVIAALIDLGIIVPTADAVSLRRAISFSLDNLLRKVMVMSFISEGMVNSGSFICKPAGSCMWS